MSIDKEFTFTKKQENGRLHQAKVCKSAKEYKGACEHCFSDIHKGTFVLTAKEVVSNSNGFGVRTVKTHRLCASCTADYIKATGDSAVTTTTPAMVGRYTVQSDMSRCLEEQKEWVKSHGIEVGSEVYILRSFVSQEGGSNIGWNGTYMAETVGKIGEVIHISNDGAGGIQVTVDEYTFWYPHFVLSKVTDYELAQAKWVQENGIKEGRKVRYTRGFREDDSGAVCNAHMNVEGTIGHVEEIKRRCIKVAIDGTPLYFLSPYTALEVVTSPTYAERQAQWVKENNVKGGTKVRVTRTFTECEDGSRCCEHDDLVGMTGSVCEYVIPSHSVRVDMSDGSVRAIPYFALEVIKEPTYRPFNNDELNDLVGEVLTNKQSGRKKLVTGKPTASEGVNLDGSYINAKDLLASFYRNGNEPCGVREET